MNFASDNTSGAAPEIMAALHAANDGYALGYGEDAVMDRVRDRIREVFEAPEAIVYLVATGTAANALALSVYCPPWGAVFCHRAAHIAVDECGAPEFYTGGARLALVEGASGKMTPATLSQALATTGTSGVHGFQRAMLSITNVTEAGTVYAPAEIAALTDLARAEGLPCHLDGARFANAIMATNASPADMTWKSGIDIVTLGGTKNGCLGVEAVVMFDAAKAWEFELRRKRGGHLWSKNRFLAAQMEAYLAADLWLRLAGQANAMAAMIADGLLELPDFGLIHPVHANISFPHFPKGTHARAQAAGASYYEMPAPQGREAARLVASWSTTPDDVAALLGALRP